jgi:two-component system CheB/CheR fusion protein
MLHQPFPIVGIGASAGGVEALEVLFQGLPPDSGMAFVLVTHLPVGYVTTLPEIIGRHSAMAVTIAANGELIEPNHVYVCPASYILTIKEARLVLAPRGSGPVPNLVDALLYSLAEDRGEQAIGIVLSGGGSDGAVGIGAIKQAGGFTMAQGPDGSEPAQTSMPATAIATGLVDIVLPIEEMADRLVQLASSGLSQEALAAHDKFENKTEEVDEAKLVISRILEKQLGHDFSGYKGKTFIRRVLRRMQITQFDELARYIDRLRGDPDEVNALFGDLLIGVTHFFRDSEAFAALETLVIPRLFQNGGTPDTLRVWVPGCSTGEEAYSIAILMREHMDTLRVTPKLQIFATDIDEGSLAVARYGNYPNALLQGVSQRRLDRFFSKQEGAYTVAKEIRDFCIFSTYSVIRDPPFSRLDLISCRNLLIYLGSDFQARVIPAFHFALRPGGFLFLGSSENVSQYNELFQRIDRKHRLFQRRDHVVSPLQFPVFVPVRKPGREAQPGQPALIPTAANLRKIADARVLDQFAPAHVIVNREGEIVYYSVRTGKYLEAAPGLPSRQLVASARRGLRIDLRHALQEAMETGRMVIREPVPVEIDDRVQNIRLAVEPVNSPETDPLFLVLFTDLGRPQPSADFPSQQLGDSSVEQLHRELRDTRERLQATVEEYESALEELKAANEEMVSVNEELQSTNEELETSKEELQSVNEELHTVNTELNSKIDELDRANSDLRNLFESTQIATVLLDGELIIRSFTPAVTTIFNLISTDRGRPLTDIASHVETGDLRRDIRMVLERGQTIERSVVRSDKSAQYLMRILPYRGRNNVIEGVLLTFFDLTNWSELKPAAAADGLLPGGR